MAVFKTFEGFSENIKSYREASGLLTDTKRDTF